MENKKTREEISRFQQEKNVDSSLNTHASDGLLRQNIVLMSGLLTGPVIAGATNFESAVVICLAFSLITIITVTLCRFISRRIVYTIRIIIYALIASIVYIPVYLFIEKMMGTSALLGAGIYVPVLITNPVILSKTESRFYHRSLKFMLPEVIGYIIGFDIVCLIVGLLRDVLVGSRIGWLHVNLSFNIPALETSFGGFIMVGVLAGLCRALYNRIKRR